VRGLPSSFLDSLKSHEPTEPINVALAKKQKEAYAQKLLDLGVTIVQVPEDDMYPDCVFIEDTAVIIRDRAVITLPGHPTLRGECEAVKEVLRNLLPHVLDMKTAPAATCDGGDVLFTGREIICGLSKRTNQEGSAFLQRSFPDFPLSHVVVSGGSLHLKSVMSMVGNTMLFADTEAGHALHSIIQPEKRNYGTLFCPEPIGANCLWINGVAVVPVAAPRTAELIRALPGVKVETVDMGELAKADGALTCCSLLF